MTEQQPQKKELIPFAQYCKNVEGMSDRQLSAHLKHRARKEHQVQETKSGFAMATVLSIVFDNTEIRQGKRVIKPGKVSSGLR